MKVFKERGITYRITWEGNGEGRGREWRWREREIDRAGQDVEQAIDAVNIKEVAGFINGRQTLKEGISM